jgi:hypothetical protein
MIKNDAITNGLSLDTINARDFIENQGIIDWRQKLTDITNIISNSTQDDEYIFTNILLKFYDTQNVMKSINEMLLKYWIKRSDNTFWVLNVTIIANMIAYNFEKIDKIPEKFCSLGDITEYKYMFYEAIDEFVRQGYPMFTSEYIELKRISLDEEPKIYFEPQYSIGVNSGEITIITNDSSFASLQKIRNLQRDGVNVNGIPLYDGILVF